MRVIAGTARRMPLRAPRGLDTRPTSDKVRGAIFSMLAARGAVIDRVLDLYAGTGALAIEALSRGSDSADLVERAPAACAAIRANLERTRLAPRARVLQGEVERLLPSLVGRYDLVFIDPPYADQRVEAVLAVLAARALLDQESTVVYEHSRRTEPPPAAGPLSLAVSRRHGDTVISLYE